MFSKKCSHLVTSGKSSYIPGLCILPPQPLDHPTFIQMSGDKGCPLVSTQDSSQAKSIAQKICYCQFPVLIYYSLVAYNQISTQLQHKMGMNAKNILGSQGPKNHHAVGPQGHGGVREGNTSSLSAVFQLCSSLHAYVFLSFFLQKPFFCFPDLIG